MNKALAIVFFVFLFSHANAELLLGIAPKISRQEILYPGETSEFVVSVFNDNDSSAKNVVLRITGENGIFLIKNGEERVQVVETIAEIRPGQRERVFFTLHASDRAGEKAGVVVEFGTENVFASSFRQSIEISQGALTLEARALRDTLNVGGKSSISVTARNTGRQKLEKVLIELVLPAGILPITPPLLIMELAPGDALVDKGFGFELDPAIRGSKTITVRASFTENGLPRFVEKKIEIQVQDKNLVIGGIIIIIVALILLAVFMRKQKKQKP